MASCTSAQQSTVMAHVLFVDFITKSNMPENSEGPFTGELQNLLHISPAYRAAEERDQVIFRPAENGGGLVFLGHPETAILCAIELTQQLVQQSKFKVRMGVHSGLVYVLDGPENPGEIGVAGDGIKLAQRVTNWGDSRHILVSNATANLLGHSGRWPDLLHDLGEAELMSGVNLKLFNLYSSDIGNPEIPLRIRDPHAKPHGSLQADSLIGELIDHYVILRKIGHGGMGVVYEAEDTDLQRRVAVKFLGEDLNRNHHHLVRFRQEARAASSLNHPNICTVHELGSYEGRSFIAMELLQGETLRSSIQTKSLGARQVIQLAIEIAEGLAAAHGRGIVHRDIKPRNIFVTSHGHAKILDFGLVKLNTNQPEPPENATTESTIDQLTGPGQFVGTVAYMSPEQARGEDIDARSDLFSFGIVLYEMASGSLPFRGDTSAVIFDAILNRPPAPYTAISPEMPKDLERIIGRALQKNL